MQCKNRWEQYEGGLDYDYNEDTEAEVNCLLQFSTHYMGVIFYPYSKCQLNFVIRNTIHVCLTFQDLFGLFEISTIGWKACDPSHGCFLLIAYFSHSVTHSKLLSTMSRMERKKHNM